MTDAHTPSSDDAENDREYMLLRPEPEAIGAFLGDEGIDIETAVVTSPSGDTPGTLTIQFWTGKSDRAEQEVKR